MTGIAGCCALAASGHAAMLPISMTNSRRCIALRPDTFGRRWAIPWTSPSCPASDVCLNLSLVSFNHLVGEAKQCRADREAKLPRCLHVHDKFKLGGSHDGQVRRVGAFQYARHIDGGLTPCVGQVGAITRQAAGPGLCASIVDGRHSVASREVEHTVAADETEEGV